MYEPGDLIKSIRTGNVFQVQGRNSEGNMGLVLFARRRKDNRVYALKTLKEWGTADIEILERAAIFRNESLVWITLGRHPNIVQAFWFDIDEDYRPFVVMERVEGPMPDVVSVRHLLKRLGCLDVLRAVRFVLQALNGLEYAKRIINQELCTRFIHRDIKPDNLLIGSDDTLKVSDFGLVMAEGGTPAYKSPEQEQKKSVEEKTDVYALGCVLHEMLNGVRPVGGRIEKATPEELGSIISRCLDRSPLERPSFSELQAALQAYYHSLEGHPLALASVEQELDAEGQNARGAGFDELGHYDKALDCYNQAIEADSKDPRYYLNRANTRAVLGDMNATIEDYRKALELEPEGLEAHLGLASFFARNGEREKAHACYCQATLLARTSCKALCHVGIGNLLAQEGRFEDAEKEYCLSLDLRPSGAEAFLGLGNIYLCRHQYDRAKTLYKEALRFNPLYEAAHLSLARLYQLTGEYTKRDESLIKASHC